jgi:hypothetical protein
MWVSQCSEFFDEKDLIARIWTPKDWNSHKDEVRTIWIVSITLFQPNRFFDDIISDQSLTITSTFYDEAHLYARSTNSKTIEIMRKLNGRSKFKVLMTGTLFPLGLRHDARPLLHALNGTFQGPNRRSWNRVLARALERVLEGEDFEYNTLVLRMLLMPFTLRRTSDSTWDGKWIVKQDVTCPHPPLLPPTKVEDDVQERAEQMFKRVKNENTIKKLQRADHQRYFAWSPIWLDIMNKLDTEPTGSNANVKVRIMEELIASTLHEYKPTSRLLTLASLIKALKDSQQAFIIVSDRLFLVILVHFVRTFFVSRLIYRSVDGVYVLELVSSLGQKSGGKNLLLGLEIEWFLY